MNHVAATCTGCGLTLAGGDDGCLALYREIMARGFSGAPPVARDRLAWDTYCLQHPERYCISAKSLAAHLGGLCWGLEYGGHASGYAALQRLLNGPARFDKPALPAARGALTIGDVVTADDPAARASAVEQWARVTWKAYAPLQPLAWQWVEAALVRH